MDERLLIKCENTIVADEVVELLHAHGIVSRQHDESQDPRIGAYGPLTGISIFVFERDNEQAKNACCVRMEGEKCRAPVLSEMW